MALVRSKAAYMGQVTQSGNTAQRLTEEGYSADNCDLLGAELANLMTRYLNYTTAAKEYLNSLGDADDAEIDRELTQQAEVQERYSKIVFRAEKKLKGYTTLPMPNTPALMNPAPETPPEMSTPIAAASNRQAESTLNDSTLQQAGSSGVRIPLLKQKSFDGSVDDWLGWWNTFKAGVHEQPWDPVIKFAHLQTLLTGQAKLFIEGLPHTPINYSKATNRLLDEYQQDSIAVERHIAELIQLPAVKANDIAALKTFRLQVMKHTDAIQALDLTTDNLMALGPILLNKMPEYYLREWHKDPDNNTTDYNQVITFIERQVRIAERFARHKKEFAG